MHNIENIIQDAKSVLEIELQQLAKVKHDIDESFAKAVIDILEAKGKCIITGMGKSGIIGRKIAESLSSTGTSSFFVHPGEAFHGDLGMFEKDDIVIMLSNSGETDEVLKLMLFFEHQGNKTISITSNADSTLAKHSTHHVLCKVEEEACPLQLEPTSSTTAALAVGDAIVVSLMNLREFKTENFARFHPGGSLGRKLLTKVKDVMHTENLPIVKSDTGIKDLIHIISESGYGLAVQVDDENKVIGIVTDGDIRRAMEEYEESFFDIKVVDISTKKPLTTDSNNLVNDAECLIEKMSVNSLLVTNNYANLIGIYK